jgi:hypothetical protein
MNYAEALRLSPDHVDARWERAVNLLLVGDYRLGWQEYEWRWRLKTKKPFGERGRAESLWLGREPIVGQTLLIRAEQGVGDTIQMARYVPALAARGARVVLEVPGAVARLLAALPGVSAVTTADQSTPDYDLHCPMMSLPLALGTTLETIPFGCEAYLKPLPEDVEGWRGVLSRELDHSAEGDKRLRVGVVWNGGFRPDQPEVWETNERRNVPLELFAQALDIEGIDFVSLQKGDPAESEIRGREGEYWKRGRLYNYTSELSDFADTAGLIANLDLVISVDTSTAHLSAAMGKPTWILNRYDTCWRWLLDREDSPWYGSVKLYRQGADRDWRPVLQRLSVDLQRTVN